MINEIIHIRKIFDRHSGKLRLFLFVENTSESMYHHVFVSRRETGDEQERF